MAITRLQEKYLRDTLSNVYRMKLYEDRENVKEPAAVTKARQVVDAWKTKQNKILEVQKARINAQQQEILELIAFGEPEKALVLLKRMAATNFFKQ